MEKMNYARHIRSADGKYVSRYGALDPADEAFGCTCGKRNLRVLVCCHSVSMLPGCMTCFLAYFKRKCGLGILRLDWIALWLTHGGKY